MQTTFASPQTILSMQVTLSTTIEVTEYLILKLGFKYVLTAKLNQDCLEVFQIVSPYEVSHLILFINYNLLNRNFLVSSGPPAEGRNILQ